MFQAITLILIKRSHYLVHLINTYTNILLFKLFADYEIEKGTLIFLNNYTLNMSPDLWTEPEKFSPERFLTDDGRLIKPEHFLPFGGGRRSCMGYKMTQYVSFSVLATIMQQYSIAPHPTNGKVPRGDLALPYDTLKFIFTPR